MESVGPKAKRQYDLKYCGHCLSYVSKSSYYRHKELYFDYNTASWNSPGNEGEDGGSGCSADQYHSQTSVEVDDINGFEAGYDDHDMVDYTGFKHMESDMLDQADISSTDDDDDAQDMFRSKAQGQTDSETEIWDSSDSDISDLDFKTSDSDSDTSDSEEKSDNVGNLTEMKECSSDRDNEEESNAGIGDSQETKEGGSSDKIIWDITFFVLIWQSLFKISNAAVNVLLKFLRILLILVPGCQVIANYIPQSVEASEKVIELKSEFETFVVCPECHSIYIYSDCVEKIAGKKESKKCCHVKYPKHPQASRRKPCNTLLLKKVRYGKSYKLVPCKVYCYRSLEKNLHSLIDTPGFVEDCELWRKRCIDNDVLCDIYDGRVWKEFNSSSCKFLQYPHHYLVMLNADWFQPFTHIQYSLGAIYLVIQNLPRHKRFLAQNIMLIGLLPGPKEPAITMNSYLCPLVEELKQAWEKGFFFETQEGVTINVRVALTSIVCDLPASRKVCGFYSHAAVFGCSKCYKSFSDEEKESNSFSMFDKENWTLRNKDDQIRHLKEVSKECTKTNIRKAESKYGVRYSVLMALNYFDPVVHSVIDPMHNLYLGTAKHVFKLWIQIGIIDRKKLAEIDEIISSFKVPYDKGRLPSNMSSNYGGFTAAQWQSWVTLYSPVALKNVIPQVHLQCWLLFVRACSILGHRILTKQAIEDAQKYLDIFCKKFEMLYGSQNCTPNMHLHMHLCECFYDFGPPHSIWCFAFERYNGLLGSYFNNKKSIEPQIMKKFVSFQVLKRASFKMDPMMMTCLPNFGELPGDNWGNAHDSLPAISYSPELTPSLFLAADNYYMLPPLKEKILPANLVEELTDVYSLLYPSCEELYISPFYRLSGRIRFQDTIFGSTLNGWSCQSSSVITAHWFHSQPFEDAGHDHSQLCSRKMVGVVQYFLCHELQLNTRGTSTKMKPIMAYVSWKEPYTNQFYYGTSAIVSCDSQDTNYYSFIPVEKIENICASYKTKLLFENVLVACPVPMKYKY